MNNCNHNHNHSYNYNHNHNHNHDSMVLPTNENNVLNFYHYFKVSKNSADDSHFC